MVKKTSFSEGYTSPLNCLHVTSCNITTLPSTQVIRIEDIILILTQIPLLKVKIAASKENY